MGSWSALLVALSGPLAKRVLAALGIGFLTMAGLSALQGQIAAAVSDGLAGVPASALQVLQLAGFVDAFNVWLAALATVAASAAIKRLGVLQS